MTIYNGLHVKKTSLAAKANERRKRIERKFRFRMQYDHSARGGLHMSLVHANKYPVPHQGEREKSRRVRQMQARADG